MPKLKPSDETNDIDMKILLSTLVAVVLLASAAAPEPAQAQLLEVHQTVFGMDCAPCAHALEKRLGGIDGVTEVKVSLNEGLAELTLQAENVVTLSTIREAVEASGFAAKDASIRLSGTARRDDGGLLLISEAGERFVLQPSDDASASFERLKDAVGKSVVIMGRVPEGAEASGGGWRMEVTDAHV